MTRSHRRMHVRFWLFIGPALIALLIYALLTRPPRLFDTPVAARHLEQQP